VREAVLRSFHMLGVLTKARAASVPKFCVGLGFVAGDRRTGSSRLITSMSCMIDSTVSSIFD
jgi:hypothetical protein